MFEKHSNLDQSAQVFQTRKLSSRNIFENRVRVFLALYYNAPKSEHNIDNFRYTQFIKSTRLNKPMQLSSLPPTSAAAQSCLVPNPNLVRE
jgi:hypothetical protein